MNGMLVAWKHHSAVMENQVTVEKKVARRYGITSKLKMLRLKDSLLLLDMRRDFHQTDNTSTNPKIN